MLHKKQQLHCGEHVGSIVNDEPRPQRTGLFHRVYPLWYVKATPPMLRAPTGVPGKMSMTKTMILPRRLLSLFQNRPGSGRSLDQEIRLLATNVTRHTLLASSVEVAGTGGKRSKGLLGRRGLAPGDALWIVPCEAVHTIGMQFSIDLVYLDRQHRIKKIRTNVPPWRLSACLTAHSVIELAAGSIRATDAQPGDLIEFSPAPPQ
jgi:uncharacterized protein